MFFSLFFVLSIHILIVHYFILCIFLFIYFMYHAPYAEALQFHCILCTMTIKEILFYSIKCTIYAWLGSGVDFFRTN